MRLRPSLAVLVAFFAGCVGLGGCYSHYTIPTAELTHLDGYDVHNERSVPMVVGAAYNPSTHYSTPVVGNVPVTDRPYRMLSVDGDPIDFNSKTELTLHLRDGGTTGGRFISVNVRDGQFSGRLFNGQPVQVPLQGVDSGEMSVYSPAKTMWLTIGISTLVATVTMVAVFAAVSP